MSQLDLAAIRNGGVEGAFSRYEIPGLLVRAARTELNGRLYLITGGTMRFMLGFSSGHLVMGGSSEPAERLGRRMVENGRLSFADEAQADDMVATNSMLFGDALVMLGLTSIEELERTLLWHGNWLVQRVLTLAAVTAQAEPGARLAQVAPPVPLLRSIEDGLRQYDPAEREALRTQLARWRFQAPAEVEDAAHLLGGSPALVQLAGRLGNASRTYEQVASLALGDDLPVLTLLLTGLVTAQPRIREAAGARPGGADLPLPIPLPGSPVAVPPLVEYAAEATPARVAPHEPPPSAIEVARTVRYDTVAAHAEEPAPEDEPPPRSTVPRNVVFAVAGVSLLVGGLVGGVLGYSLAPTQEALPAAAPDRPAAVESSPSPAPPPTPVETPPAAMAQEDEGARVLAARHLDAGNLLLQKKQVRKAIAKFREALTVAPNEARAHRSLGIAYTMLGDAEAAVRAYKAYLALAPDAPDAAAIREMVSQYESAQ